MGRRVVVLTALRFYEVAVWSTNAGGSCLCHYAFLFDQVAVELAHGAGRLGGGWLALSYAASAAFLVELGLRLWCTRRLKGGCVGGTLNFDPPPPPPPPRL